MNDTNNNIEHTLKVAERGEFIQIENMKFAIDKILPVKHGKLLDKILRQIRNNNDLSMFLNPNSLVFLIDDFFSLINNDESFKQILLVFLESITNSKEVNNLSLENIVKLSIKVVKINQDYFLGKITQLATAQNLLTEALTNQ